MTHTKTQHWDAANHLETREDIAAYLEAALENGDPQLITAVLGDIGRSKGMTQFSRETGFGHESLYKSLSIEGRPEFLIILKRLRS